MVKINYYYLCGIFFEGIEIVLKVEQFIFDYEDCLDNYWIMIFYYKVVCLYFGNGDNWMVIKYLNCIIQLKDVFLWEDIQVFVCILNLIVYFEFGMDDYLLDYQIKFVYCFFWNMGDLYGVQQEILNFLCQFLFVDDWFLMCVFCILYGKLVKLFKFFYEKWLFLYLDIIFWLECKIEKRIVQEVIWEKFLLEQEIG